MAIPQETPQKPAQDAGDGLLSVNQTLSSYRQLFGSPTSTETRFLAIQRMYQRLARHYDRPINELHMRTYPEALLDLPDDLLPLAFERVAKTARFFPSVEEIRGAVALDNARQVEELWQPMWQELLRWLKRNFYDSNAPRAPIDLSAPLAKALETLGGGQVREGLKAIASYHPTMYGTDNWPFPESPAGRAERIEKRVRDLWESYR